MAHDGEDLHDFQHGSAPGDVRRRRQRPRTGGGGDAGANVFRLGDTEYDLANGAIRILRPKGDCKKAALAYWAYSQGKPYSVIDIDFATAVHPHTESIAYVNGTIPVRVMFDTGAPTSALTLQAAKRAGVTPDSPGVTPGGPSYGIGRRVGQSWAGALRQLQNWRRGGQEHEAAHRRRRARSVDMLVGADFFLSHRVYVATSQRRLYFTYNGGPVFNLTSAPAAADAAAPALPGATDASLRADELPDAAAYACPRCGLRGPS